MGILLPLNSKESRFIISQKTLAIRQTNATAIILTFNKVLSDSVFNDLIILLLPIHLASRLDAFLYFL